MIINIRLATINTLLHILRKYAFAFVLIGLSVVSVLSFNSYLSSGLGLSYNDARSHLDIGRRVVEGLKPGLAQLGSVWLPLNHMLMVPLIWNDWMWHSGLAGAIQNMIGFVITGLVIFRLLERLSVGLLGKLVAVIVFAANINILYLQSTAMTELLLLATMTVGVYELVLWHENDNVLHLVKSAFWIMLATLTRYDGWFLLAHAAVLVIIQTWRKKGAKAVDGMFVLFCTLGALGIVLWVLWNQMIFKDPLYFALGPFSAHAQQQQMKEAGVLFTEHNLYLSIKTYFYAMFFNTYTFPTLLGFLGFFIFIFDTRISKHIRLAITAFWSPLFFNILALYLGFSVLFVQGIAGDTWFNVRYGIMLAPTIAFFIGYLIDRAGNLRWILVGLIAVVIFFAFVNQDSVSIDDARVGSSQKNVSEVSGYLEKHAKNQKGFVLISAASHDAIIFSSNLPMKRFIHEGTGLYWENALALPDRWAKWIVMRTYDDNDLTWKGVSKSIGFQYYNKVAAYPFADVYELQASMSAKLNTEATLGKQK